MSALPPCQLSLSYDHGTGSERLIGRTLGCHFDLVVAQDRGREALVSCHQRVRLTYAQLGERVDLFARGLLKLGIEAGDRVGIWSANNIEWVITQLATAKIGAILVNINPAYRTSELEYALRQSGVQLLVLTSGFKGGEYLAMIHELAPELIHRELKNPAPRLPDLRSLVVIDASHRKLEGEAINFEAVESLGVEVPPSLLEQRSQCLQFDDPINIQYTSGTTGFPKGVTLSHHNLLNNSLCAAQAMGISPSSRFCVPMPFYHCGGMVLCTLATLLSGGTLVIPSASFDAETVLDAIDRERCTHLAGVPTMFIAELEHPRLSEFDLSSLSGGFMAGAPCPVQLMRQVADRLNARNIVIIYGQTEASPVITTTTTNDSLELRATTVGRVIPHLELKVVDPVNGQVVPLGSQGEICARGYAVMLGYWQNPAATKESIDPAGWLHTGDLGTVNADGYVNITGRKKDMIIRGGENIYPREVEEVLHGHPAVAQAQVFGVPDDRLGEEVALWLQLKQDAATDPEEIRAWLRARVAHFKVPRYVKIVTEYPMTVTGKVQKFAMREEMIRELGLEALAKIQTA